MHLGGKREKGMRFIKKICNAWHGFASKLNVVPKSNKEIDRMALKANIDRVYSAALVIAPFHFIIAVVYALKGSLPTPIENLWKMRIAWANFFIFVGSVVAWFIASYMRKHEYTRQQMTMFQHVVLTFVIFGGIVITHIDLLLFSSVTALMISLIVVGAFFYLRPRVALAFFTEVLVLFTISVLLVGLPRNVLVSNLTNGIVAIAIGMTLSVISWRGFAVQYVQTKKILEQQRELEQMAYRDPLTGLPNRRFLDEVIKKEIALIKRGTRNSCVVMIDIDDFKEVNDTYGHPVGDEVLKQLAQLLLENIRESDTLARLGGEEFVILLSDANCDGAYIVANKLREQIKNHVFKVDGYVVQITASFGVGPLLTSDQGPNYYSLVDKALYKAKSSGKNQIAAARDLFQ